MRLRTAKLFFFVLALVFITLNLLTLVSALPHITGTQVYCDSNVGCINVARDFSAYYEGAHRLFYNPAQVYQEGNVSGDYQILPNPQQYRYAPFFLPLFVAPFLFLFSYQNALLAFDIVQFLFLPLIAYLLFKIMCKSRQDGSSISVHMFSGYSLVLLFSLLQPYVWSISDLTFWSWSYFRLWLEGEARILQMLLLVLTFYLILRDSKYSGLAFVLSSFDPRMSILALPLILFLCMKEKNLRRFAFSASASFSIVYLPTLMYANLGNQFLATIFIKDFALYSYELIPFFSIISLSATLILLDVVKRKGIRGGNLLRKDNVLPTGEISQG